MANGKFGAKEVMNATLYDANNKPVIYFDTLKTSSIEVKSDKVYARGGRGNPKLITWEINKEATLKIEDALLSPKSMELVSGIATVIGAQTIQMRQATAFDKTDPLNPVDKGELFPLIASGTGVIELGYTPKEAATAILVYDADDDCGTPIAMSGATLATSTLTVAAAANKKVIVYYSYTSAATAETYVIDASHFSGTYKLVGDTVVRNVKTKKDESFQITIPNLKWSSALTLDFKAEGDPSPTSFECEILKADNSNTMIQMVKY